MTCSACLPPVAAWVEILDLYSSLSPGHRLPSSSFTGDLINDTIPRCLTKIFYGNHTNRLGDIAQDVVEAEEFDSGDRLRQFIVLDSVMVCLCDFNAEEDAAILGRWISLRCRMVRKMDHLPTDTRYFSVLHPCRALDECDLNIIETNLK